MKKSIALLALITAVTSQSPAMADGRLFGYSYESTTMAEGKYEFEQWVTWKTDYDGDEERDRVDLRSEIEWGVTDRLQLAAYFTSRYEDGLTKEDKWEAKTADIEVVYNLTSATLDPFGSALYGEVKYGGEKFALESKLLLDKAVDDWYFATNLIVEAEWEGAHYQQDKGEVKATFGASYNFSANLSAGAEAIWEREWIDLSTLSDDDLIQAGPVVNYRGNGWWATATTLFAVTDDVSHDFEARLLFGIPLN